MIKSGPPILNITQNRANQDVAGQEFNAPIVRLEARVCTLGRLCFGDNSHHDEYDDHHMPIGSSPAQKDDGFAASSDACVATLTQLADIMATRSSVRSIYTISKPQSLGQLVCRLV